MSSPFHPLCDSPWRFDNVRVAISAPIHFTHAGRAWTFFQVVNGVARLKEAA